MRRLILLILVAVVGLSFIGFIIWFLILRDTGASPLSNPTSSTSETLPTSTSQPTDTTAATTTPEPTTPAIRPEAIDRATVEALAKAFATRYASYSTESNFANITDLLPQMTADFAAASQQQVKTAQAKPAPTTFSATVAHAIKVNLTSFDPTTGTAKAEVMLQLEQLTSAGGTGTVSYRTMVLTMTKLDTTWKVGSANWQTK